MKNKFEIELSFTEVVIICAMLIFIFSCKKEIIQPIIPPADTSIEKLYVHLSTGGTGDNPTTQFRINNGQYCNSTSFIDTTFEIKKNDTIILISYSNFIKDWATIKFKNEIATDTSETNKPARAELIIK